MVKSICFLIIFSALFIACDPKQSETEQSNERIYLNYTEAGLDSAYSQTYWADNTRSVFEKFNEMNKLAISEIGSPERIKYDSTESAELDLYKTIKENAPIHIFIHGGAWRGGNGSEQRTYNAMMFVKAGAHFVSPDYLLVQDAGGSIFPMVEQLRKAVDWVYRNAESFGGNPDSIFLSGHSAGGHLAGVLVTTDWAKYGLPKDVIKGAVLFSGMYDLYPVSLSSRNEYVSFTKEMIDELSPMKHVDKLNSPLIIAYGSNESPEFQRQSEDFERLLEENGRKSELYVLKGYNHFEIMISMGNPYELAGMLLLRQMGLNK